MCSNPLVLQGEEIHQQENSHFGDPFFNFNQKQHTRRRQDASHQHTTLNEDIPHCIPCLQADQIDALKPVLLLSPSDIVVSS